MSDLVLQNIRVVSPASGRDDVYDVHIRGAVIADYLAPKSPPPSDARVIDGSDCVALPGPIDLACQFSDPGAPDVETLEQTLEAAARGGYTRVFACPNTAPAVDNAEAASALASRLQTHHTDRHAPSGAFVTADDERELAEIGLMAKAGVSLFTNAPGRALALDVTRRALESVGAADATALLWGPEPLLAANAVVSESAVSTRLGLRGEPEEAEVLRAMAARLLAEKSRCRTIFGPVSTTKTADALAGSDAIGALCCAWSLLLDEDAHRERPFDVNLALRPPLRRAADREALIEACRAGDVAITPGHRPAAAHEKEVEFGLAKPGGSALELAIAALVDVDDNTDVLDPNAAALGLAQTPARLLGDSTAQLRVGDPADLVILSKGDGVPLSAQALSTPCRYSPYLGLPRRSFVEVTIAKGRVLFERDARARTSSFLPPSRAASRV